MCRCVPHLTLLVCLLVPALATAGPFRKGPYLQNVSRTEITVMWESSRSTTGEVRLLGASPRTIPAPADTIHEVVIDGLSPGHRYPYEVECEGEVQRGEFATAPAATAPFSFVVFGDSRTNVSNHRRLVARVRREVPDFILDTGDLVDDGAREGDWQTFFDVEAELLRENVMFPSIGNHDRQGRGRTADNYRKYFSLPENSPDPERYYAFTYGNSRFLILDSNSYSFALTDQTAWIERQLEEARLDPGIGHIFVSMHHPPFSVALHGGQAELRNAWTPLFERYRVDAVFSGHDHCYERAERNGVHYIVSGGGGAPLYPRSHRPSEVDTDAYRYFERVIHYVRVNVIGDLVEVSAIRGDGTLMETISWGTPPTTALAVGGSAAAEDSPPAEPAAPAAVEPAPVLAEPPVSGDRRSGFGWLGILGGMLALVASAAMVWAVRR